MKILIFSDSHGNVDYMRKGIEREKPDLLFHLGDVVRDAARLKKLYPELPLEQVRGNCDGSVQIPEEQEITVEGKRLWLLHGHTYQVKWGLGLLREEARTRGVDAVFFGHTHNPVCVPDGNLWVVNPGTCRGFPEATCAVAELDRQKLFCRMVDLKSME